MQRYMIKRITLLLLFIGMAFWDGVSRGTKYTIDKAKKAGMLCHTFWMLGYPGETYEEMQATVDFALNSGADSFSFAIVKPLPGTHIYRQVIKEKLWWDSKEFDDRNFHASMFKVDGFNGPEEVEKFVKEVNFKANLLLKEKNPERFKFKYGDRADSYDFNRGNSTGSPL